LIYKFIIMVTRQNPDVTKTTGIRSPEDEEPFRPQEQGFDFAFGLRNYLDPSVGYFTVLYINQTVDENGKRIKEKTKMPYKPCGTDLFNFKD
jgi:hypothetical protein